eukprot:Tamp_06773.p1 GENE.Tamp_06773~~Tamp_06773.p1  ORF type:complete len:391 (-),score=40.59 Tamp_06773:143-1315(-)
MSLWAGRHNFFFTQPTGLPNVKSMFTLAVLEDSGWYDIDYQVADAMGWGYLAGCPFLTSCSSKQGVMPKAFCQANFQERTSNAYKYFSARQCTFDRSGWGNCTNSAPYMDGCPYVEPIFMCSNWDEGAEFSVISPKCPDGSTKECMGQAFGASSACFDSSLFDQGFSLQDPPSVGCYEYKCAKDENKTDSPYTLSIRATSGAWQECAPNKEITLPGYTGSIKCPPEYQYFCTIRETRAPPPNAPAPSPPAVGIPQFYVSMTIQMRMTLKEFNLKLDTFRQAVATAAKASPSDVDILQAVEVDDESRRATAVQVDFRVKAASEKDALAIQGNLSIDKLNVALAAAQLPESKMINAPTIAAADLDGGSPPRPVAAKWLLSFCLVCLLALPRM